MKQSFKKISKVLILFVAFFAMLTTTYAESAPSTLTMTYHKLSSTAISFPSTFRVKTTSSGKYVYCAYYAKHPPVSSITYTRGSQITDNGINYILKKSYSASSDSDFFIYQTALWVYMVDQGLMPGAYYDITVFKSTLNSSSSSTATTIKNLVSNAKKASANDTSSPTITVSTSGAKFTLQDGYYVSSGITVTSSTSSYTVTLTSAPSGSTATVSGSEVIIKVPANSVTSLSTKISFKVSNSKNTYVSYSYTPSDSSYQTMYATYKTAKTASASGSLTITSSASINITKTGEDGSALSGASMQVLNSSGTVVDSWTSTTSAHSVTGLSAGTYTVQEVSAPSGYKLSTTKLTFTVNSDGTITSNGSTVTSLSFSNEKTSVVISKQDITTSEELPGATLVIKDSSGKEIASWTSGTSAKKVKGLSAGTYTLTETVAPDGYTLSTETITFTLDKYGNLTDGNGNSVEKIVMYNSPETTTTTTDVTISKRDITSNEEVAGATLVVKDSSGNVIDKWVSTTTEHKISNLSEGTYTLTETIAPDGYILSSETITFKIDSEGKLYDKDGNSVSKIIMYNQKETVTGGASISKRDVTTGEELPGATLVVKDYDGNVIDTWVSTDTPHVISDLAAGIYTLTETVAPDGYILSSETITFTVEDDGSVTSVVMYNTPDSKTTTTTTTSTDVPVENTASFKTITSSVVGTIIVLVGTLLIVKTSKKKNSNI